uniref:Uncharacterized protein n=1 Tax=Rhizophora mucronata TaxID=61149 RepID=A0A2P2KDW3_RHIMU
MFSLLLACLCLHVLHITVCTIQVPVFPLLINCYSSEVISLDVFGSS